MKNFHYIITVLMIAWFIGSVIFASNINYLKNNCFIFILALVFIGIGIYLDYRDEKQKEDEGKDKGKP
jgi:preprotein translocase subunit SecG